MTTSPEEQKPDVQTVQPNDKNALATEWVERVKKASDNLEAYFKLEKRLWEYWWMWSPRSGPFRNNYVPPDGHAIVESTTPRMTKGRPSLRVIPRINQGTTMEQANLLLDRTQNVEQLALYADQEMDFDAFFERFVKRGVWMDFATEKITWKTETTEVTEEVQEEVPKTFLGVQYGSEIVTKTVTRQEVIYNSPVSELLDNTDFIYPLGYATIETLPWAANRITKWRSEIDEKLYTPEALAELDRSKGGQFTPVDYKADRLRIREFPEPLETDTEANQNSTSISINDQQVGNQKDDYKVQLLEIYVRKNAKYPKGRLITIANDKTVLRDIENPTPDGDLPFNVWSPLTDTYHLRGMGLVREMEKVILYKKKQRDQRLDNVDIIIQGMGILQSNEEADDDEFTAFPNNIIRLSNVNAFKPLVRPDVTGSSVREEEMIDRDGQRASASSDYTMGTRPSGDRSATEISAVVGSSGEKLDGVIRGLNRVLNRRGKMILKLYQANWDTMQLARIMGPDGAVDFKEFDPLEFQGDFDFMYDVRPVMATKEVVRKQGMELIGTLSKLPPNDPQFAGMNLRPVVREVVKTFDELRINMDEVFPAVFTPPPPPPMPLQGPPMDGGIPPEGPMPPEPGGPPPMSSPTPGNISGQALTV
jgi:hypothetical protein